MIITIVGGIDYAMKSILATNLAASRAQDGHKVLLIEADLHMFSFAWGLRRSSAGMKLKIPVLPLIDEDLYTALQNYVPPYRDIVVAAGELDSIDTKTALIAAQTVIIPVAPHYNGFKSEEALVKSMDSVRLFNPLLRTLVVMTPAPGSVPIQDYAAAVALAEKIPSAAVAGAVLHDCPSLRHAFEHGLSIFEDRPLDEAAMSETDRLYQEVCKEVRVTSATSDGIDALSSGLKRWLETRSAPRPRHQ